MRIAVTTPKFPPPPRNDIPLSLQLVDLTTQTLDLLLLRLQLSLSGEGLNGIGAELLDPFTQHILMNVQVPAGLRHRHPAFPNQLDCLNLELSSEPSSPHDPPPAS